MTRRFIPRLRPEPRRVAPEAAATPPAAALASSTASVPVPLFACAEPWLASTARPVLRVRVPFDFAVGVHLLPAGDYSLEPAAPQVSHALVLRDRERHVRATLPTGPRLSAGYGSGAKLLFRREGGLMVLSDVCPGPRPH
jgi:hypothetical protein